MTLKLDISKQYPLKTRSYLSVFDAQEKIDQGVVVQSDYGY